MSGIARAAIAKLARRIASDPTAATVDDVRKLSRALCLLLEGKVPDETR